MGRLKSTRRKGSVLEHLKAEEAQDVLRRLLAAHPDLGAEAETIARSLLGEVTFEAVAADVEDAVRAMDLEDLNGRAGQALVEAAPRSPRTSSISSSPNGAT